MRTIYASVELVSQQEAEDLYRVIEVVGRTCYQSESVEGDTPEKFIQRTMNRGHLSVVEHGAITVKIICDRGVTHELVRHRLASMSQESSRYCNYSSDKFENQVTYICLEPGMMLDSKTAVLPDLQQKLILQEWEEACQDAERHYMRMLELGASPQIARSVLNTSTKSTIIITMNPRNWMHFINLRYWGTTGAPHPQMIEVSVKIHKLLSEKYPALFSKEGPTQA